MTTSEALATTETALNRSSEEEQTTTQGEMITTTNEEGPMTSQGEPITTTNEEGPASPTTTEGEPATSSGGPTTTNIEGATSQSTVSKITTTISEPVTHSTSSDVMTSTMADTPTVPAVTTPPTPPPMLDVMINGDSFTVMQGGSLTLECHVTGGGAGTLVSWFFNDIKLSDVGMAQTTVDSHGVPRLSSPLTFDSIDMSDAGMYVCEAHSPANSQTVRAPIQVNVERKLETTTDIINMIVVCLCIHPSVCWLVSVCQ